MNLFLSPMEKFKPQLLYYLCLQYHIRPRVKIQVPLHQVHPELLHKIYMSMLCLFSIFLGKRLFFLVHINFELSYII